MFRAEAPAAAMAGAAATWFLSPASTTTRCCISVSIPSTRPSADGTAKAAIAPAARARRIEVPVPVGTIVYDDDTGELLHDFTQRGRAVRHRARRPGRARQSALRHVHASSAHRARAGQARRRKAAAAGAETAGRRGAGGVSERRQIDADLAHFGGAAQDRRLSVHYARTEPGRGQRGR